MISSSMTTYLESSTVQDYVKHVNDELYGFLLHKQPIPDKAWLPSSPEPSSQEIPVPIYKDPLPGTVPSKIGKFVYPPKKRLRGKTSDGSQASSSKPSGLRNPSSKLVLKMPKQNCLPEKMVMALRMKISALMKRQLHS